MIYPLFFGQVAWPPQTARVRRALSEVRDAFVLSGPVRFADEWTARSRGNHVRFLRSAGMTVALVSDKQEDVEAFRAAFRTTVASRY